MLLFLFPCLPVSNRILTWYLSFNIRSLDSFTSIKSEVSFTINREVCGFFCLQLWKLLLHGLESKNSSVLYLGLPVIPSLTNQCSVGLCWSPLNLGSSCLSSFSEAWKSLKVEPKRMRKKWKFRRSNWKRPSTLLKMPTASMKRSDLGAQSLMDSTAVASVGAREQCLQPCVL